MIKNLSNLKKYEKEILDNKAENVKTRIYVSLGTCGIAAGTEPVYDALSKEIENQKIQDSVQVIRTGCMGLCHSEPSIEVLDCESGKSAVYGNVKTSDAGQIVGKGIGAHDIEHIERTWYYPEYEKAEKGKVQQAKLVLRNCGIINPEKIEDYIAKSGYRALGTVLEKMSSQNVIDEISKSGLRGRGGGGFPAGKKWSFAAAQKSNLKYVVCNADEGDPGAFMDRAVLEGDPHSVLEAMAVTGYAIGASRGIIYIRAEYPLAIKRLKIAIEQATEKGLLGENIFSSGFSFKIEIKYGAGAFVCGEETALLHSIEGKRGEPTFKPPFPAVSGLWGKPTIVNNVETFANIAAIIRKGAEWFRKIGTENSPGTKIFALAGKISKVGLIEVPMGTLLKDIIFEVGGGINGGKKFKAVQTGGPSGGCLTAERLETPIDYDSLKALGSMMGSGGMIVMDEDDCMVDVAKFFLDFTLEESCGKCTPCRIGNKRLHEMLDSITMGKGTLDTVKKIKKLSEVIRDTALCGLGQTSPNPALSTIENFEDEYMAHVIDKTCPAGVCADLIKFVINDNCVGCTLCARNCPVQCISGERRKKHEINQEECIKCGVCYDTCKFHAIDRT